MRRIESLAFVAWVLLAIGSIAGLLAWSPIAQPQAYYAFADARPVLGIPNGLNVLSNLAFLPAAIAGLIAARRNAPAPQGPFRFPWERRAATALFAGLALTALGSAGFHLAPSDETLVWDRIPMTLVFMPLLALVLGERLSERWGRFGWLPLTLFGPLTVLDWRLHGDLRPYLWVQFFPLVSLLALLFARPARYHGGRLLVWVLLGYTLAKLCELTDAPLFGLGGVVSGHTLKHLAAGAAGWGIHRWLADRRTVEVSQG